jgi:adenylosuccinate lyase
MNLSQLTAISPIDGRYFNKVCELQNIFSEFGLIKYRVIVEVKWLIWLINNNIITLESSELSSYKKALEAILSNFALADVEKVKAIETKINHDVKAIEYFIREHLQSNKINEFIHFACTSEDINNLAYSLMLKTAVHETMLPALQKLEKQLAELAHKYADVAMLAHTHGQPATPTTVGKELANFVARLHQQIEKLKNLKLTAKFNGATGNYNAHFIAFPEVDWQTITQNFIESFGLQFNVYTTQIEPHDTLAELCQILMRINTIFIDLSRDIWGYTALNYFNLQSNANEVGSSTMPHKTNPIDFENAEGNLGLANALFNHLAEKLPISRWQRDLSDSTVLRNIGVAFAHALLAYKSLTFGLTKLSVNQEKIAADLDQHWEVLSEAIQTVMRRYNIADAYEQLKTLTKGQAITKELLHDFISQLKLPVAVKKQLLQLTPSTYLGLATVLAKKI